MTRAFILIILLTPLTLFAQFTISGRVLNHDDGRPVPQVSVFLNNATIGGNTNSDGFFNLQNVKPGKYDLVVSIVGYSTFSEPVIVSDKNISLPDISLFRNVTILSEVKIIAREDPERQKNLDLFKDEFIGTSEFSKQCRLVNPELLDLDFDQKTNTLKAKSIDFLVIENHALGYRIKYLLSDFTLKNDAQTGKSFFYTGFALFEELKGNHTQQEQWKNNREASYANSVVHFLRSAISNKLPEDGFNVLRYLNNPERPGDSIINENVRVFTLIQKEHNYRDSLAYWIKKSKLPRFVPRQVPASMSGNDIIDPTNKRGIYAFGCSFDALYIVYNKLHQYNANSLNHLNDQNNTSSTLVTFNKPYAFVDGDGTILNAGSVTYSGAWANKRLAELLPVNYRSEQENEAPVDRTVFKKTDGLLKAFKEVHPIEKPYLHFDKPYYAAGDTLYFKAYVADATNQLSDLSNALNVDLINPDNTIRTTIKLKMNDGTASGDFALQDTMKSGNYRLRAYTNAMRNTNGDYFYNESLFIANAPLKQLAPSKKKQEEAKTRDAAAEQLVKAGESKIDVLFFPEGGRLVNGAPTIMAFKAVNGNGAGVDIKGTITDENGKTIVVFASSHSGMGTFNFTPLAGKKYRANITYGSNTGVYDLTVADDKGYSLSVDNTREQDVRVNITSGMLNQEGFVNIIVSAKGAIYFYTTAKLINHKYAAVFPKNNLPQGIVNITLFSTTGEHLNERRIFNRSNNKLELKTIGKNAPNHTRQQVKLGLSSKDAESTPVGGNFSVAVTNETVMPVDEDAENTILAHFLLSSELKGYIEKPNYYFNEKNKDADASLDALMLTQGYSGFEWKQILNEKLQPAVLPEDEITASGTIKDEWGKPILQTKVSMLSVSRMFFMMDTVADENGHFVFKHFPVNDSIRYIIQASDKKARKTSRIELDKQTPPKPGIYKPIVNTQASESEPAQVYFTFADNFHKEEVKLGFGKNTIMLREVTVKEKREEKYLHHSSNLNGAGHANDVITADQLSPGCPILTDCIRGRLHGIEFSRGTPYYGGLYGHLETAVFIDGIEIQGPQIKISDMPTKADMINMLSVSDIASIEIITDAGQAGIYGVHGGGGVILINTKQASDIQDGLPPPNIAYANYTPTGYYKARVFYSPRYDVAPPKTPVNDLRTTIYWNPDIITDKNGSASFDFFNADTKGIYRVVVEGIDEKGNVGRQVYRYKVE